MAPKRDGGRGLNDTKICQAVTVGIIFGVVFSLYRLRSNDVAVSSGESEVIQPDSEVIQPVKVTGAERLLKQERDKLMKENEKLRIELKALSDHLSTGKSDRAPIPGPRGTVLSQRTNPLVTPDTQSNPALAEQLAKIAVNNELIVAISNYYIHAMLKTWFENIQRVGITNFLVIALDDQIASFCSDHNVPYYRRDPTISDSQKGTGDNHAISGLKFHFLREFLVLGYNVFLSDVDIVMLKNPFDHLHRDCDVESMTDGFNNYTAYGYDDVTDDPAMGWARYAHTMRIFVFNSGLFYIRATVPSIELLDRVTARLSKENSWDQAVFNEELFFPSHPGYVGLHASTRVLDYYDFLNSKTLFREVRKDFRFRDHVPVTIHVNYHPDKYERMLAIVDYYVHGKKDGLMRFPDGSE